MKITTIIFECKRKKFIITTFVGVNACYFNVFLSISTAQLKLIYLFLPKLCAVFVKVPQSNEIEQTTLEI